MAKKLDRRTVRLGDVADVFVGMATSRKEGGDAQEIPLLQVGNINEQTGSTDALNDLNKMPMGDKSGVDRYRVQPGDVVVSCKGTLLKTGMVQEATAGAVATANLVTVRARGEVSTETLFMLLRSEGAKRRLKGLQKVGATIASLSYKDIQSLEFSLPDIATQRKIANLLDAHREFVEATTKALRDREEIVRGLVEKAFWGDPTKGGGR